MSRNTPAATQAQLEALVAFMEDNRDLARGISRSVDGKVRAKRLWESLCNSLNAMGSCIKSVEQWQRVWADRKYLAKKAAAIARRAACATGRNKEPTISHMDLRITSIMGESFGEPLSPPAAQLADPVGKPTHSPISQPAVSLHSQEKQPHKEPSHEEQQGDINSWRTRRVRLRQHLGRRARRVHARQHLAADSTRMQLICDLIKSEEDNNEELREIRDAIVELCNLMRQYFLRNNRA